MQDNNKQFPTFTQIERIERPSVEEFRRLYDDPKKPVVITGAMSDWKAMKEWSHEWFRDRYAPLTVKLSRNPRHTSEAKQMRIGDYIDLILSGQDEGLYMPQYPFENLPDLANYVVPPPYIAPNRLTVVSLWIGPARTVLGFHKDNHNPFDHINNLLTQIRGRKRVVLAAPDQDKFMYRRQQEEGDYWHSRIDLDNPDYEQFPLFRQAQLLETILGPGEMLFIPANYWHYVRALDKSISVSFWWRSYRIVEIFAQLFKALQTGQLESYLTNNAGIIEMKDIREFGGIATLSNALDSVPIPPQLLKSITMLLEKDARAELDSWRRQRGLSQITAASGH